MLLIIIFASYFLGAIPFAYLAVKLIKNCDIRDLGSGNVGATNAARVLGIKRGFVVFLLDMLKGFGAISLAGYLYSPHMGFGLKTVMVLSGLMVIIGHNWSIFLKFSGGKGVATTLGVVLRFMPLAALGFLVIWFLVVVLTKYVSLGSILGAVGYPVTGFFIYKDNLIIIFLIILSFLIIYRHRANIKRLFKGEESKLKIS